MLDRQKIEDKMRERGFVVYAYKGRTKIQFISSYIYDVHQKEEARPIINIVVDLKKEEFQCVYNVKRSMNLLNSPSCGAILNDSHFDRVVSIFETQARWLENIPVL